MNPLRVADARANGTTAPEQSMPKAGGTVDAADVAIAFVGATLPPSDLHRFPAASSAGNQYQFGLMSACARLRPGTVTALTVAPYRMWSGRGKLVSGFWTNRTEESLRIYSVPFINLVVIKQATIAFSLLLGLMMWAWANRRVQRKMVVYNTVAFLAGPTKAAAKLTRSEFVALVADVPDAGLDKWVRSRFLTRLDYSLRWRLMRRADRSIFLTKQAGNDFGGGRPFVVVEGGVAVTAGETAVVDNRSARRIVHAGSLGYLAGIELALDAVSLLQARDIEFHVYGDGPRAHTVAAAAARHPDQIIFHGPVAHTDAIRAELGASVLVCPRLPDGQVTPYTFPSKLYEYLATGVPVICNDLEGIPTEAREFFNIPADATPTAWATLLEEILQDEDGTYVRKATAGADFVRHRKNWDVHAVRVLSFLGREEQG